MAAVFWSVQGRFSGFYCGFADIICSPEVCLLRFQDWDKLLGNVGFQCPGLKEADILRRQTAILYIFSVDEMNAHRSP